MDKTPMVKQDKTNKEEMLLVFENAKFKGMEVHKEEAPLQSHFKAMLHNRKVNILVNLLEQREPQI